MLKPLTIAALVATLVCGGAGGAAAAEHHVTVTGPDGGTADVDRHCGWVGCKTTAQFTGPDGKTVHSTSACVRGYAPGRWNCKATITGPNGNSVTRRAHAVVW